MILDSTVYSCVGVCTQLPNLLGAGQEDVALKLLHTIRVNPELHVKFILLSLVAFVYTVASVQSIL